MTFAQLVFLMGEKRATAYEYGEGYLANLRVYGDPERKRRDTAQALTRWIDAMRACVAEYDECAKG